MNTNELERSQTWRGSYKNLCFKIIHWGVERGNFPAMNNGKGCWNFYIYFHASKLADFDKLWLLGTVKYFNEARPTSAYISYDPYSSPISVDGWNGGITFYEQHDGPNSECRYIKAGCDYSRLWDMQRGYPATLESVLSDALRTIDQLTEVLTFK